MDIPPLYHGTTPDAAFLLCNEGWKPNAWSQGGNMGLRHLLYLSTDPEDALWFAQEKGSDMVVEVTGLSAPDLVVDPDDGTYDTLEEEIGSTSGLPGKVALVRPVPSCLFRMYVPLPVPGI